MNRKVKNILIFVGIGLVLVLVYVFLIKKDVPKNNLESSKQVDKNTTTTTYTKRQADNKKIEEIEEKITALLKLEKIVLDDEIFKKDTFNNLVEHTVKLEKDLEIGRPNPFAILEKGVYVNNTVEGGIGMEVPIGTNSNIMKTPVLPNTYGGTIKNPTP